MERITKTKQKNIHSEHRKRVKKKFKTSGLEHFECHEVLELLLYYAIPQKDTNPIAHELIRKFHNFTNVLDASIDELVEVDGIKEHTALLIKLIPAVMRRYHIEKSHEIQFIRDQRMAKDFITQRYDCSEVENFFIFCLRADNSILDSTILSMGTCSRVEVQIRELTEYVLKNKCNKIIISHNHPNGNVIPSDEDIVMTQKLDQSCILNDIEIVDHVIISTDDVYSFQKTGLMKTINEAVLKQLKIIPGSIKYQRFMEPEGIYKPV